MYAKSSKAPGWCRTAVPTRRCSRSFAPASKKIARDGARRNSVALILKTPHGARSCKGFSLPMLPDSHLKIVIVDDSPIRAAILEGGLREAGHVQVIRIEDRTNLLARIYAI